MMKFHAAKEKPRHGVKGPPFFPCEWGAFCFKLCLVWRVDCVHCSLSTWTVDSRLSMQASVFFSPLFLAGQSKSSQVTDLFLKEFPTAHHFSPLCKYCPPFTYIGGPKGRNSVTENRTFHFGEPPFFWVIGQSNWLIAKNWTWEAPHLMNRRGE
jgi:hypothetical protein